MGKVFIADDLIRRMDDVLSIGTVNGKGVAKRHNGNRTVLIDRIVRKAMDYSVGVLAEEYHDKHYEKGDK